MTFANTRVFIGGLEGPVTKEDIEGEFSKFGKLDNVWIAQNPPGFAFIVYESDQDAEEAVNKMNGETFLGSKIRVEHSKPKRRGGPRRDFGGMRGGRGSYGGGPYNGGSGGGGRYGSGAPYNGGGAQRYGGSGSGDRRDDRSFDRGGYGKTSYQTNGGYRENRRGGYDSRPREYRGSSDRHASPPRYD